MDKAGADDLRCRAGSASARGLGRSGRGRREAAGPAVPQSLVSSLRFARAGDLILTGTLTNAENARCLRARDARFAAALESAR